MTGVDIKRLVRALFFIFVSIIILFLGNLPTDFSTPSFQVSTYLYAWCAAFIICRPGSAGVFSCLIITLLYAIYNDEGVALGSFTLLLFCVIVHEMRDYFEFQSYFVEWIGMSALFLVVQISKNLILQIFFTHGFATITLLKFTVIFAIVYPLFVTIIKMTVGRRDPNRVNDE